MSFDFFNRLGSDKIYDKVTRPIVIADQLRTPENMGAILRLAGNIGAQKVLFISDKEHGFKRFRIGKPSAGAIDKVDWQIIGKQEIMKQVPEGFSLVALETSEGAENIFQVRLPEKIAFLVGNEVLGISDEIMKLAHEAVYIPIPGQISSLNVSHALSIGMFEWLRQMGG